MLIQYEWFLIKHSKTFVAQLYILTHKSQQQIGTCELELNVLQKVELLSL